MVAQPSLTAPTASSQTVCTTGAIAPISTHRELGARGTLSYQWDSNSTNANTGGTSLGSNYGAQTLTYSPPTTSSTGTTYYYAMVSSSVTGCNAATTPVSDAAVTVVLPPSLTAPTATSQTVCSAGTPASISSTESNGTGALTYQWFSSSSNSNTGGTSLGSAYGAQTLNYSPPATSTIGTTYYYVTVTASGSGCGSATSPLADASVTVVAQPSASGPLPTSQTLCTNGTISAVTVSPINGTGGYTYQWYSNTSNSTSGGTNLGTLNGAQTASYTPPVSSTLVYTYYYCVVGATGTGCNSSASALNDAAVAIVAQPLVSSPTPATQTDCNGGTPTNLTVSPSGGTGNFSYQWYSDASNANSGGANLGSGSGAQTANYTPPTGANGSTYYYCVINESGVGCNPITTPISDALVTVVAKPSLSSPTPASQTVCTTGAPASISSTESNGTGALTYQWYSNSSNSNTGGISLGSLDGAQSLTYSPPATSTTGTTYYYLVVTATGSGCGSATSPLADASVTVAAQPSAPAPLPAGQTVCTGGTPGAITVSPINGTGSYTYQWYSVNSDANSGGTNLGSGNGGQTASYSPPASGTTGTTYYYCLVGATGTGCSSSASSLNDASVAVVSQPTVLAPTPATQTICQSIDPNQFDGIAKRWDRNI